MKKIIYIAAILFALFGFGINYSYANEEVCCSSVLFIPGFKGVRLHQGNNQLWEPNWVGDVNKLGFDDQGNSVYSNIETGDIIKRTNIGMGVFDMDIYQGISDDLDKLVSDGVIKEWKALPYDWRKDLPFPDDISKTLYDMYSNSFTGKIIIIGHSNGGLYARKLATIMDHASTLEAMVQIGTPIAGAPSAISALLHGTDQSIAGGLIVSNSAMREFGKNMRGAYNLLPSKGYFDDGEPVIKFATTTDLSSNLRQVYGDVISTYEGMKNFIFSISDGRSQPDRSDTFLPAVLNQSLFGDVEYLHHRLQDQPYPSDAIDYPLYKIAGTNFPTPLTIDYFSHSYCPKILDILCGDKYKLAHVNMPGAAGDGTVPTKSALYGEGGSYLFDLGKFNEDKGKNISHADLTQAQPIRDMVLRIIKREPSSSLYINNPLMAETATLYRFGTHSPVTLDAYDHQDRHTGRLKGLDQESGIDFIRAEIPNSIYQEVGSETYITVKDPKGILRFKIQGADAGTFIFDAIKRRRSAIFPFEDQEVIEAIFTDVVVEEGSDAEVVFDPEAPEDTVLTVDEDGDGDIDVVLVNEQNPDISEVIQKAFPSSRANKARGVSGQRRLQEEIYAVLPDPCCP